MQKDVRWERSTGRDKKKASDLPHAEGVGDLYIHCSGGGIQVWVASPATGGIVWMEAKHKDAHPSLPGYVLSFKDPSMPVWVTLETVRHHDAAIVKLKAIASGA